MSDDTFMLSIVIPAYNEARRLPTTLATIRAYLEAQPYAAEVLVVDDGSSDATAKVAAAYPGVTVLQRDHRGKGFAVRAGALAAQGSFVLLCDADLAVPIEEWSRFESYLRTGDDVVIGSREGVGATREGEPWYRHVMGRVFNHIIALVALRGINDTQCGFKAMSREVAQDLFRRVRIYGDDAPVVHGAAVTAYDVELLFLARKAGYRIREVPVPWQYGTETKVNPVRDSLRNLRDVLQVRWNDLRGRYRSTASVPPHMTLEK
ncbi:MAG: glycosyltransferase family 2 protein [Candidatus Viridilinea halotolerans]|uniref:dolichyl-phosphate beta-glucosyltransferase n=1 Tax=Candidatus Viridilinea halotolerans TaxID=2491704 RepID=A0A426U5C7_9CHLR|nr:MAG: glycosyltransferase family 2 protein [Candidatus Viridilinea halotolerans]